MRAYSIDLRKKIVDTYLDGNISQRKLAQRFQVAPSFVQKLLKQYRETGSLAPKKRRVQTPTKLNAEQLQVLANLVEQNNDATLEELKALLLDKTGVSIGRSTVDRMLKKLKITRKKKSLSHAKRNRAGSTSSR